MRCRKLSRHYASSEEEIGRRWPRKGCDWRKPRGCRKNPSSTSTAP
jgi:hypothetical protein